MNLHIFRSWLNYMQQMDVPEYLQAVYVVQALSRRLGDISDVWNDDCNCHIRYGESFIMCAEEAANAGFTEVHFTNLPANNSLKNPEKMAMAASFKDLDFPLLISHTEDQSKSVEMLAESLSLHCKEKGELEEYLFWTKGDKDTCRCSQGRVITLSNDGASAIAESQAFSNSLLHILDNYKDEEVDVAVAVGNDGTWRSSCLLLPVDIGLVEVCGLQTRVQYLKEGWANMLLNFLQTKRSDLCYLTTADNLPSRNAAESTGFQFACQFKKTLLSR